MDVDRSVASATARSSGNFERSEDSNGYHVTSHPRSQRQGNVGKSFRSLFKRDRHLASKGWFNPEDFTAQKREWAKLSGDKDKVIGWPAHLFEQFVITGLPPTTDVKSVITDAETMRTAKSDNLDADLNLEPSDDSRHRGLKGSPLAPQVLYSYPPESPVSADLPSFCFPHGVQPTLLERTPSMSSLNDLLYSQSYLNSDASSFIFLLKVADNLPLYGVCCYMEEMLHRPPSLLKALYPDCNMPLTRYMVAAPRCYCFLTHYPFFSLHMKVLHMILGLERLDRITMFIDEVASMPLGGGRGLSGRLDSRELPKHAALATASQHTGSAQQEREQEQRRRQQRQATAVEQLRCGGASVGPSPLGGRSSMPELHAPPPAVATRPQTRESSFPLNPHQSYDEEWGTMGGQAGGGHESDSDVFLTPHASVPQQGANFNSTGSPDASPKQTTFGRASTNAAFPPKPGTNSQTFPQPPSQPSQQQSLPMPHRRLDLASSASAPAGTPPGPPTGPPSTPERPLPSTAGKFYSPQTQAAPQLQHRSPSSLLSRASARIRVALEASEATIKAGPADPPPRLSGLPPSSGHRRTNSQQVPNSTAGSSSMHRRNSSWQDQQQQQQASQGQSGMVSRGSESTLGGYMTAPSEAPSGLSDASHPGATSLASVQQHLRNISAQSLSGFSDTGTPVASDRQEPGRGLGGGSQRGARGVHREGYESPASQAAAVGQRSRSSSWDGSGERPAGRQNSDPMAPVSPFAMVNQQPAAVPSQWQTFDQPDAFRQQQDPQQSTQQAPWGQPASGSASGMQQPWSQGQGQFHQQPQQQPWEQGRGQLHQQPQWQGQQPQQQGVWSQTPQAHGNPNSDPQGSGDIQYQQQQPPWGQQQGQAQPQPPGQVLAQQKPSWQSEFWSQNSGAAPQQPLGQGQTHHQPQQWDQQTQQQGGALLQSASLQAQHQPPSGPQSGPVQHLVHGGEGQPLWSTHQTAPSGQNQMAQQPQDQQTISQSQGSGLSAQQVEAQAIAQRPWLQSQGQGQNLQQPPGQGGLQQPPGRLQNAPSGVPLEHRSKTIRTMSFRQVVRSASEGDAMSLQTEPATALQVMQAYHISSVPQPGEEFEFCPDPSLQPVHYLRGRASEGLGAHYVHRAAIAAAEAEAGEGLACWTVAALCQSLSLDNILLLLTGVLLEKQLVMFCPNIGLLSTCVLALIPLLRPFAWHSLLAPVLPDKLLSFLEAPVPFVIGVQYKTSEVRSKCSGLMRVNLYKDQIKTAGSMPPLPNDKALFASLRPAYNVLKAAGKDRARGRPMYAISEEQKRAADSLLKALQDYLTSICGELQSYAITDVQTPDRAAVLLKDAFIESFPARDRAFVRQFTETQMFSVYCDTVIK